MKDPNESRYETESVEDSKKPDQVSEEAPGYDDSAPSENEEENE